MTDTVYEKITFKVFSSAVNYFKKSICINRNRIEEMRQLNNSFEYFPIPKDQPILTNEFIDSYLKEHLRDYRYTVNHDRKTIRILGLE